MKTKLETWTNLAEWKRKILEVGCLAGAALFFIFGWFSMRRTTSILQCGLAIVTLLVAIFFWMTANFLYEKERRRDMMAQFFLVNLFITVWMTIYLVRGAGFFLAEGKGHFLVPLVMIILPELFLCGKEFTYRPRVNWWERAKSHKWLFLLLFVITIISAFHFNALPRWDEGSIFYGTEERITEAVFDYGQMGGHLSLAYMAFNFMSKMILGGGSLRLGMCLLQIIIYLISIACFYGILGKLFPKKGDAERTLLTSVYAVSPFILALSSLVSWDFWCSALTVIVIYTALLHQWLIHLLLAGLFCFTKEPALMFYAFFCATLLVQDFLAQEGGIVERGKKIFFHARYWGMLLIGSIWLFLYFAMTHFSGGGSFHISQSYIVSKCNVLFVLNFNWLLLALAILGAVVGLARKSTEGCYRTLLPVLVGDVAFILTNFAYVTVNHARYIDGHISVLALFAVVGICQFPRIWMRMAATVASAVLLSFSNFYTFDPLTLKVFENVQVGENTVMVSTGGTTQILSDYIAYNYQYRYFDKALDEILKEVLPDENLVVMFPLVENYWYNGWFFEGATYSGVDGIFWQHWDEEAGRRYRLEKEGTIPYMATIVTPESDMEKVLDGRDGVYCYLNFAGDDIAAQIRESDKVLEEGTVSYRGFEVNYIRFCAE